MAEDFDTQLKMNIKELIEGKSIVVNVNTFDNAKDEIEADAKPYEAADILDHCKMECLGLSDEKEYSDDPFESLGAKMENVTPDGKIKKLIIREGYGETPKEGQEVTIDYNAYLEYNDTPFDSTYLRKKPHIYYVNSGTTVEGLNIGVQTMKVNEKAQLLIHYDYAYGKLGCLDRIPPEASILYEVELHTIKNYEALSSHQKLPEEERNQFKNAYKYAQALLLRGKDLFSRNIKSSIKQYNTAADTLEYCIMDNDEEEEKQQELLLRIYTNLVICYVKESLPKKACVFCNKIYKLTKNTKLKVPCKVYFNNARALRQLCAFDQALSRLKLAKQMEPHNEAISKEFILIGKELKEHKEKEKLLARTMMQLEEKPAVTDDFKDTVMSICADVVKSHTKREISEVLTEAEEEYAKTEAQKHGLLFSTAQTEKGIKYCIFKKD